MKRYILSLLIIVSVIFVTGNTACNKEVEQSPEMIEFTSMIKGQSADVLAALIKFAATDDVKNHNMAFYNLKEPNVTEKNGDCYLVEFKTELSSKIYEICWKDKKIYRITEQEEE